MKLNKKICINCWKSEYQTADHYQADETLTIWAKWWCVKAKDRDGDWANQKNKPPKECPYILEHTVLK